MEKAKLFGLGIAMSLIFLSLQPAPGPLPALPLRPSAGGSLSCEAAEDDPARGAPGP